MNDKFTAQMPDIGAYLARIGLDPDDFRRSLHPELPESPTEYSAPHTKAALDLLVHAHLFTVPFEAIDQFDLGRECSLEVEAMFDKIVTRRRGGFCFELNGLFYILLRDLGFTIYPTAMRVLFEGEFPPAGHRGAIVTLPTGERCTCDVGFGGPSPVGALYLDCTEPQVSGKITFRMTKLENGLYRETYFDKEGNELPLLMFSDRPYEIIDFFALNAFMSRSDWARFHNERVLNLLRPDGSVSVVNDMLRIHKDGVLTEIVIDTPEKRKAAYVEYFGIPEQSLSEF